MTSFERMWRIVTMFLISPGGDQTDPHLAESSTLRGGGLLKEPAAGKISSGD
jgi:hypothetical protein